MSGRWSVSVVAVDGQVRFKVVVPREPLPVAEARALASYLDTLCAQAADQEAAR